MTAGKAFVKPRNNARRRLRQAACAAALSCKGPSGFQGGGLRRPAFRCAAGFGCAAGLKEKR